MRAAWMVVAIGAACAGQQAWADGTGDRVTVADVAVEFARRVAVPCVPDEITLAVATAEGLGPEATLDASRGGLRVHYRMAFNDVTEGWNWHPEAKPESEDYYRFKYVLLKSVLEDRPGYRFEDKLGAPQDFAVRWRYDYFLAFDNPYDFYARGTDDDAGFATGVAANAEAAARLAGGDLRMALRVRLAAPCVSDSTTFYKATHAQPVDFTLKKRYLVGTLEEVIFYDAADGRALARLLRR